MPSVPTTTPPNEPSARVMRRLSAIVGAPWRSRAAYGSLM
ncbi:hypothetical protein TR70_4950 [Burkholderia pseudomallei]|nr:hypothetical protein TR70_4950 [Burkholderia pseudomallei]